ncbi:tail fiber domain-containing protein [bacterium]|nr:tail fiber domain-containing protein [bacterium]
MSTTSTTLFLTALVTGAGSLCLDANKQVVYNGASDSCLSSTRDTKEEINPLVTEALEQVLALNPVSFRYKHGDGRTRYGFIAEDAADVDAHLATYDAQLNISGIDDRAILAILVGAIQDLARKLADLAEHLVTKELAFQRAVGESLTLTRELCIAEGANDASPLCLTKSQLNALLNQIGAAVLPSSVPPPAANDDVPDLPDASASPDDNGTPQQQQEPAYENPEPGLGTEALGPSPADAEPAPAMETTGS